MDVTKKSASIFLSLLLAVLSGCDENREEAAGAQVQSLECATRTLALREVESVIQHQDGDELHQYWVLSNRQDLWGTVVPDHDELMRYRAQVHEIVPDTSPLGLIQANRESFPWLERDYPAEGRINRLVEAGVGTHRSMSCLETQLLAYQASRFPLYGQPSEIVALILQRMDTAGDLIKVYIAADGDATPPKPDYAVAAVESDVADGWRFVAVFHNHTFDHSPDRGLFPVAAPSASDLQVSVALHERFGLESILVTDGFSTLELTADEFRELAKEAQ